MQRLLNLKAVLSPRLQLDLHFLATRASSSSSFNSGGNRVKIGDAERPLQAAKDPQLVPVGYLPERPTQSVLRHLRWLLQKDGLGQDMFLIGPPGSFRRSLALMYLELTNRECEFVSLSRDTTESDLKQRREIVGGSALYIDQSAVRAALRGRILVLEGIEKAERNVLPVLNNLLENREMQLDDGRFLVSSERYDQLLREHSAEALAAWRLERCDPNFRVIALGLPVPKYAGSSLDPPLRSRFQARDASPAGSSFQEALQEIYARYSNVEPDRLLNLLSFAHAVGAEELQLPLPDFPLDRLPTALDLLNTDPGLSDISFLSRLYPFEVMLKEDGQQAIQELLQKFDLHSGQKGPKRIARATPTEDFRFEVTVAHEGGPDVTLNVPGGPLKPQGPSKASERFIETPYLREQLAEMALSHGVGDLCLLGPRGCGKSALGMVFARQLGYEAISVLLHPEMSARDLLQHRATLPNGDTEWRHSPLVRAALTGQLVLLDGLHRLHRATFSALHRLAVDREADLFDGRRLLRHDRFDALRRRHGWSEAELTAQGVLRVHPAFRIVALAEPPAPAEAASGGLGQWLPPEALSAFLFHPLRPLSLDEERAVILSVYPEGVEPPSQLELLLKFAQNLRGVSAQADPALAPLAKHLSTRQLLRIARRLASHPHEAGELNHAVHKACLYRFLPRLTQRALDGVLEEAQLTSQGPQSLPAEVTVTRSDRELRIGRAVFPLPESERDAVKIPDIRFYDNQEQLRLMEAMLEDYLLGEHLLLIGNQGVGKNKVIDRLLHLMRRPREYLQLHRDTTVHSLTVQPGLKDGVIVWEDSPLVRAVSQGHLLVVDEADKAPTQVTCVLKTLVESGEMFLADGRRILPPSSPSANPADPNQLVSHPDFRMAVLANRPGFPFLGNDFFAALGDLFSCHVVDNPPLDSEVEMLRRYGPDVSEERLLQLVRLFAELRTKADEGELAYPYSTRELVSIVRHLQAFPREGLASVVRNVFDFDAYSPEAKASLLEVLHRHGVPIGASLKNVRMAAEVPMPILQNSAEWQVAPLLSSSLRLRSSDIPLQARGPVPLDRSEEPLELRATRATHFSEEAAFARIRMDEYSAVGDVALSGSAMHVLTVNPISLHTVMLGRGCQLEAKSSVLNLQDVFPVVGTGFRPRFRMTAVSNDAERLLIHEEVTNILLQVQTLSGKVWRLLAEGQVFPERPVRRAALWTRGDPDRDGAFKMCSGWSHNEPFVVFFAKGGEQLLIFNFAEGAVQVLSVPAKIDSLHLVAPNSWVLEEAGGNSRFLLARCDSRSRDFSLQSISGNGPTFLHIDHALVTPPKDLGAEEEAACRVALRSGVTLDLMLGSFEPESPGQLRFFSAPLSEGATDTSSTVRSAAVVLSDPGLVVRGVPAARVPEAVRTKDFAAFLEVADVARGRLRYLPAASRRAALPQSSWLRTASPELFVCATPEHDIISVDHSGTIRTWQVAPTRLEAALKAWKETVGLEGDDARSLMIERQLKDEQLAELLERLQDLEPKEGKFDPTGAAHMGGGTWAGGTGGRGTAGLGGVGGPYRLDAGHDVHQLPDDVKAALPEHVRAAAREVGLKAWRKRLNEIEMSEYDGEMYERYLGKVQRQVTALRLLLDSLQAKGKERQWLRHQTEGELDQSKLIEGLIGEKAVFKRRGDKQPEPGAPQEKPKVLRVVADVSGSMYRFNGHDGRLERQLESILMLMEAFQGYEARLRYEILGHSGEGSAWPFVKLGKPPSNNKERLNVLMGLLAHSQFCMSGDHTLEAVKEGITSLKKEEEADERFLIVLSDANLDRYGIRPDALGRLLRSEPNVNCFAIFVGTLGNQAEWLSRSLPAGHSFVCLDNKLLPQILQQIFASTIIGSS